MSKRQRYIHRPRRTPDNCEHCGARKPPSQLYFYVDGNNGAITRSAPALCSDCYRVQYPHDWRDPNLERDDWIAAVTAVAKVYISVEPDGR